MLWTKNWFETRWRFLYVLCFPLLSVALLETAGLHSTKEARNVTGVLSFFCIFAAVYLAGAGIRTQAALQMSKGLHGSTYFTLSLPVTRFRLLAVRAALGFGELAAINAIAITAAWSIFPPVRSTSTLFDLLQSILAAIACTACLYSVSVLMATFLEESWHMFGSMLIVGLAWVSLSRLSLPASVNVFGFWSSASPLVTHKLPWPAMAISVAASAILFVAAWNVVQNREY